MAGQTVDFNAIAKQFGGVSTPPANAPSGPIDYAALAKQNGATGYTAPPSMMDHLKDEGFLDSAWGALKGTIGTIKDVFTGEYSHQTNEMIRRYHELEKNGTPEERRQFAKEGILQSVPFASTAYKILHGNIRGAAGDMVGMAALPIAAEGVPAVAGAVKTAAKVVSNPEVVKAGVNVLPKGPAMVKLYDAVQNARGKGAPVEAPPSRAATLPPDVMSELTRESGPPQAPPEYQRPQGQAAPIPSPPAAWEGEAQLERLRADQASRAATGPVQQPRLLEAGPPVRQMEAPPDPSFVRAVSAQYPEKIAPGMPAGSPATPLGAPPEPQIGTAPPQPEHPLVTQARGVSEDMQRLAADTRAKNSAFLQSKGMTMEQARALDEPGRQRLQAAYSAWLESEAPVVDWSVSPEINKLQAVDPQKPPISAPSVDARTMTRPQMESAGLSQEQMAGMNSQQIAEALHKALDESRVSGDKFDAQQPTVAEIENPPAQAPNPFEARGRAKKVDALATELHDAGQGFSVLSKLKAPELKATVQAAAKLIGQNEFSDASISDLMDRLQELAHSESKAATAGKGK